MLPKNLIIFFSHKNFQKIFSKSNLLEHNSQKKKKKDVKSIH